MTLANRLTIARIALVPLFVYLMARAGVAAIDAPARNPEAGLAFMVFALAALTDSLDGRIARNRGEITPLGEFLDPLADKLLIGAALVTLVMLRGFPLWAALVIGVREIVVSLARSLWMKRGVSVAASLSGKIKTAMQVPMVLIWLLPRDGAVQVLQDLAVLAVVAITVFSGFRFFARGRQAIEAAK